MLINCGNMTSEARISTGFSTIYGNRSEFSEWPRNRGKEMKSTLCLANPSRAVLSVRPGSRRCSGGYSLVNLRLYSCIFH